MRKLRLGVVVCGVEKSSTVPGVQGGGGGRLINIYLYFQSPTVTTASRTQLQARLTF